MLSYNTLTHDRLRLFVDDDIAGDYHLPKEHASVEHLRMIFNDLKGLQQHGRVHGVFTVNGHGKRLTDDQTEAVIRWKLRHAEEAMIEARRSRR